MEFFRTHIIKAPGIATLLFGFVLHFIQPVEESAHQYAFTSWLDGHLKANNENDVRILLKNLKTEDQDLDSLIREASKVVANHADDFELPFNSSDKDEVYDLLITEWKSYQSSSSAMGKAIIAENNKVSAVQKDGKTQNNKAVSVTSGCDASRLQNIQTWDAIIPSVDFAPLQSGISINAP